MNSSHLLTPVIILSFILYCYLFSKLRFLPHLSEIKGKRFLHIDGLRGLAAVMVVCAHSWRISQFNVINDDIIKADYFYNVNLGAIGVQIFFCITSFLFINKILQNKEQNWNVFFMGRIKRLSPLYFLFISIMFIIGLIYSKFDFNLIIQTIKISLYGFLDNKYKLTGYNASHLTSIIWTLPYEIVFYVMLPLFLFLVSSCRNMVISIFLIIIIISTMYYDSKFIPWSFFLIGSITAIIYNKYNSIVNYRGLLFIIFFISTVVLIYSVFLKIDTYGYERLIIMSIFFPSAILYSPSILKLRGMSFLGEISYSIYLLHLILIFIFTGFISYFISGSYVSDYFLLFLISSMCFFVCLISTLTFKYIEYPFIRK